MSESKMETVLLPCVGLRVLTEEKPLEKVLKVKYPFPRPPKKLYPDERIERDDSRILPESPAIGLLTKK